MKNFFFGLLVGGVAISISFFVFFGGQIGFVGASPSNQSTSNVDCVGEVCTYFYSQVAKTATSTLCAIKSPAATSTLISATFHEYTATSTGGVVALSKGTSAFATTSTLIGTAYNIASGAFATVQASTSPAAGDATIIAPNTFLVWGVHAGSLAAVYSTGYTYGAQCQTVFRSVQR